MQNQFKHSALAVLKNGQRLVEEVEYLSYEEPPTTAYFLILLAQEELAKAFLLSLVQRGTIPWNKHIHRATRDHRCKQLLSLVMDYLNPEFEEFQKRLDMVVIHNQLRNVPRKVMDAINILRYEKIGRWEADNWVWGEDPKWDRDAAAVAEGALDKVKQDSLYVRIGINGQVTHTPVPISKDALAMERERAERMASLVESILNAEKHPGLDWDKIEGAFRILFSEVR